MWRDRSVITTEKELREFANMPFIVSDRNSIELTSGLFQAELRLKSWQGGICGNHGGQVGVVDGIEDVVQLEPHLVGNRSFAEAAPEIAALNRSLLADRRPYLLIGYGRLGSADPWLGIPVVWGDIGGARVLVEAALAERSIEPSQGSHFFHNISTYRVSYFSVPAVSPGAIDWAWLSTQPALLQTTWLRQVRLTAPLRVEVDGRSGRGIIFRRMQGSCALSAARSRPS